MEQDFSFVFDAMQKYRKEGAIDFAEWKEKNGWWADEFMENGVTRFESIRWSNKPEHQYLTTEELYDLFTKREHKEFIPKNVPKVKNPDGTDHVQWG